ncbi:MAG: hypothetical protein ACJ8BW_40105, partial [Ktedonobacteraceae bacterium]
MLHGASLSTVEVVFSTVSLREIFCKLAPNCHIRSKDFEPCLKFIIGGAHDKSGPTVLSKQPVGAGLPRPAPIMQFEKYMWIIEEAKSSAQTDFKIRIKFSNCMIG